MPSLVLASTSTYRRALLQRLRIPFDTEAPNVDEETLMTSGRSAVDIAMTLAEAKVRSIDAQGRAVLGGDQLVDLDGQIMGKPGTAEAARRQLRTLSGERHRLVTATALLPQGGGDAFLDVLIYEMHMRRLSDDEIERYVRADEPLDCCGAYRI
ncbi:MAG: nucleoside triphosphate pyrophosphatase, partial [Myxococcota bacterium]